MCECFSLLRFLLCCSGLLLLFRFWVWAFTQHNHFRLVFFNLLHLALRYHLPQRLSPVFVVMLVGYDLEDLIDSQDCARRQRHIVANRQASMPDTLGNSYVKGKVDIAVPVDNAADDVDILGI